MFVQWFLRGGIFGKILSPRLDIYDICKFIRKISWCSASNVENRFVCLPWREIFGLIYANIMASLQQMCCTEGAF